MDHRRAFAIGCSGIGLVGFRSCRSAQIRRIEVILAGNPDQRKESIAPGIGESGPIRCGAAVSLTGQTGQSDEIHSPDAWARAGWV
jgi:hypothetical protein